MLYYCIALYLIATVMVGIAALVSKRLAWISAVLGYSVLTYAVFIEPRWVKTTYITVPVAGLKAPLKAAVIGDPQPTRLHFSKTSLTRIFKKAEKEQPDIIFWVGDYAYQPSLFKRVKWLPDPTFFDPQDVVSAMAAISAPMGSYAVLGNHDWWWNGEAVKTMIAQTPIVLLQNEAVVARSKNQEHMLQVVGLEDIDAQDRSFDPSAAFSSYDPNLPTVALMHRPFMISHVPMSVAITFAGHSHCGQIGLPMVRTRSAPVTNKTHVCGFAQGPEGQPIFITSGIGIGDLPVRFLARPEVVIVTFTPMDTARR